MRVSREAIRFSDTHHGMVNSMMVDPARAPTPTDSCCCASSPIPEKRTIAPSGTAPKTGRTTDPTTPARDGTSSRSSDPSEIMLDALERGRKANAQCTHYSFSVYWAGGIALERGSAALAGGGGACNLELHAWCVGQPTSQAVWLFLGTNPYITAALQAF